MKRAWKILAVGVLAAMGLAACAELAPDINRVHGPYYTKDQFDGSWYFKRTVVDTAPHSQWVSQGDGDWAVIERVRFKVTENFLYGYRDWEYIPGSELGEVEGTDYFGSPQLIFAIKEHFDIRRSYNAQTGEETNVIDKNYERPWNEREYIVVDWANNLAPTLGLFNSYFVLDDYSYLPLSYITSNSYFVQPHEIDNADRARFGEDYFDFVAKYSVWPDLLGCYGYYDDYYDCAPGEVHVRWSFMKVDPDNDYEAMPFPDTVDLVDDTGNFVRDSRGNVQRIPVFERFGDYRLDRLTYDNDYNITESGIIRRASRFNIWQESKYDDGSPIPYHLRTPKPIHYYLNVEFPDDEEMDPALRDMWSVKKAAYLVGDNWNKPFREVVAMLRVMSRNKAEGRCDDDDTPCTATKQEVAQELQSTEIPAKMFEVHDNSCNLDNVRAYVNDHSELEDALNEHIGGIGRLDKFNLASACTVVEALTEGQEDAFTWERHGDLRYNMLMWVDKWQEAGWGGLGPMFMDPITAEIVSSTAHYAGAVMETSISRVLDYIDALNGGIDDFDLITGQDVSQYIDGISKDLNKISRGEVSAELKNEMNRRFNKLGHGSSELLKEISPDFADSRLRSLEGSHLEDLLIGEPDWQLAQAEVQGGLDFMYNEGTDLKDIASPVRDFRRKLADREFARDLEQMKRTRDMPKFFDAALLHTALKLKDKPREERRAMLRFFIFDAIMTHEVGHNVGMRHNFSASTDALNFGPDFWSLAVLPEDLSAARVQLQNQGELAMVADIDLCLADLDDNPDREFTTQHCLGAWEKMYSSIMDYHGKVTGDFGGLRPYDDAFIHFVYGNVLQVFDDGVVNTGMMEDYDSDGDIDGWDLRTWQFYNDYNKLPQLMGGVDGLEQRHYQRYLWGNGQTTMPEPRWAVPFKMCSDEYARLLPDCRMSDYGVTQTQIIQGEIEKFKEYYYFTHFNRGRTNQTWHWGPQSRDDGVLSRILNTFQYMYYFRANDEDFFDSDAGADYLRASIMGLNLFSEVLGYPPPGFFQELDADGGMLVSSQRDGYWRVEPSADFLGGTTTGLADTGGLGVVVERGYFNECDEVGSSTVHNVPLGAGRPFFVGFSEDYEEYVFTYVGSYFAKDSALFYLAYPQWAFLPFMGVSGFHPDGYYNMDPRTFSVNVFRLFREEVLNTFYGIITNDYSKFAPVMRRVDGEWQFEPRQFIGMDGQMPDYTPSDDLKLVKPSVASNTAFYAMNYGAALMSNLLDAEQDFSRLIKIAVKGAADDIGDFESVPMYDPISGEKQKAEFTHPVSGVTYRALRQGETPIGFSLVEEANRRKARWMELQGCVEDPALDAGLCECTYQSQEWDGYDYTCPARETMGCIMQDRQLRAERGLEYMEKQVELIENLREFHDWYEFQW